jgi:hypothetical protein
MDVYDHLAIDDLKQAATVIASFVYHTAMRDEKLPRKSFAKTGALVIRRILIVSSRNTEYSG